MAVTRTPIHSQAKGSRGENEDWWLLRVDTETGKETVEHEWSYSDANGPGQKSGKSFVTVEEFLASDANKTVKEKLQSLLDARRDAQGT